MHRFFLQTSELIQENYKLDLQAVRSWNSGVVKNVWYIIQFVNFFSGRRFAYEKALDVIQSEEYLDDSDFDEIRR